mgnify:CR=1 FL=1
MKIEVQYYPLENCSGNLCKIIVEATDYGSAAQIVMNMFNIPRSNIYSVNSYIGWFYMLSETMKLKEKIICICKQDKTFLRKGSTFDKITVLKSGFYGSMLCGPVTFLGHTDSYEMLFSSGNGRYYFTVRDGWGVEDNCFYALSIGAIKRDFKKAVSIEEIEHEINNPEEPRSTYSAMAIKMKLKDDIQILKVLKSKP